MASFKLPCPSCENTVLIKNTNLIGTKVECPKCKYRFKVEEPAGGLPKEDAKGDKKKAGAAAAAEAAAKAKKKKTLVAVVVGLVAVGILAAVGFSMIGGKKPTGGGGGGGVGPYAQGPGSGEPGEEPKEDDGKKDTPKPGNPNKPSTKDATNLLPGDAVSVFRVDIDRLRATPVHLLFDPQMVGMFRDSFGIETSDVATYIHAQAGAARDPFGVIRLKEPAAEADVMKRMPNLVREKGTPNPPKVIKGRTLYAFKSNPFARGFANTLAHASVFADLYKTEAATPPADAKAAPDRVLGVVYYDTQHLLVGDFARLAAFLNELDAKGNPKFKSAVNPAEGSGVQGAENPLYLSIDPKLKRILKDLGAEGATQPIVVFAQECPPGTYNARSLRDEFQPVIDVLDPVLARTRYLGGSLWAFTTKQLVTTVKVVAESDAVALGLVREHIAPALETACFTASLFLKNPVEFRNESGGMSPTSPVPGMGIPGMGVPGMGIPGVGIPGLGGRPQPGGGVGSPDGGGYGQPGPGGPGGYGSPGPGPGGRPQPGGPGGYGSPGPGGRPQPGGPGGFPGEGEGGMFPGGMQPGMLPTQPATSVVYLGQSDQDITVTLDLNWTDETYRQIVAPRLVALANTLKGKMAVFVSDQSYYELAAAVPKMTAATEAFPPGTANRKLTDAGRMGLKYPPATRVSFFADLLPYTGRTLPGGGVNKDLAWFDKANLQAAEAWVPVLLVPSYPQSAWRAWSRPVDENRIFGGTNYVAIAGVGLNAAYYDPADKEEAKKVGITGYDWGSKVTEVTDGLDKTIYLMQTPPGGPPQPWLAGGGATVRGLDEKNPMRGWAHTHDTPDGKPGTFALMADGSVRFIPADIDPKILLAMATRAGGEPLTDLDKHAPLVSPAGGKNPKAKDAAEPKPAVDPKDILGEKPEAKPDPKADPKTPAKSGDDAPDPREKR